MASRREEKEKLRADRMRREAEEQAALRRRRLVQYGALAALLALVVVAALIIASQSNDGDATGAGAGGDVVGAAAVSRELKGIPQRGTVLGDPQADVTVVEYGDLQCPVCRQFAAEVAPEVISRLVREGTVAFDFRQWAILGPESFTAAKAALAAGEQGRYWSFVDLFYRNQGRENSGYVTDEFLESIATAAGVPDIDRWNSDRDSPRWDSVLRRDDGEAKALGFTGTPSLLVEGPGGRKTFATIPSFPQIEAAVKAVQ
jgi:protein-disulfide isomerase